MKARLILIAFRRLGIDRRAHFCRDGPEDYGCDGQEPNRDSMDGVMHTFRHLPMIISPPQ